MVMMFVLTIFAGAIGAARPDHHQDSELDKLGGEIARLSDALSSSQARAGTGPRSGG